MGSFLGFCQASSSKAPIASKLASAHGNFAERVEIQPLNAFDGPVDQKPTDCHVNNTVIASYIFCCQVAKSKVKEGRTG